MKCKGSTKGLTYGGEDEMEQGIVGLILTAKQCAKSHVLEGQRGLGMPWTKGMIQGREI